MAASGMSSAKNPVSELYLAQAGPVAMAASATPWCQTPDEARRDSSEPEMLRDHHALHLVRSLADLEDLLVSVEA